MTVHLAAAAAVVGSLLLLPVPTAVMAVGIGVAIIRRTALSTALAIAVSCSCLGAVAFENLTPPPPDAVDAWVTLSNDPRSTGGFGVRAAAIWEGRRVALVAHGTPAATLDGFTSGQGVRVAGRFRPAAPDDDWARWRHEVGTITIDRVVDQRPGAPVFRLADVVRGLLVGGVVELGADDRALFLGMVIGDDRGQSAVVEDDFRAAGLGHLLVVSGQNVAFVIAIVSVATRRLRPAPRTVVMGVALAFFALVTRFEPSVLRAVGMAAVSVGGAAIGSPVDGRRALSAAVTVLLVMDPFLAHVLAFRLSVAATAGIVWLGGPLADRLPGPESLRTAVAATATAQLAVAPFLIAAFGPLPLAALPANLLAGPISGPIMIWGCTAGLVAGGFAAVGLGGVAELIHLPTVFGVGWVRAVARGAAHAPPAVLGPGMIIALALSATAVRRMPGGRFVAMAVTSVVTVASLATADAPQTGPWQFDVGVTVVGTDRGVIVVLDQPGRPGAVLEALRSAGIRRPLLLVATDGDFADAAAVSALRERFGPVPTFAPPMHRVRGATAVGPAAAVRLDDDDVDVEVRLGGAGGDRRLSVCIGSPCHHGPEEAPP